MKRLFFCVAILLSSMPFRGCYGSFILTKDLYDWNGSFQDRWSREAVFIAFQVLPLYGVALVGDVAVANPWEFWTGKKIVADKGSSGAGIMNGGKRQAVLSFSPQKQRLRIDIFDHYHPLTFIIVEPQPCGPICARENGRVILQARTIADGSILIEDPHGNGIHRYTPGK